MNVQDLKRLPANRRIILSIDTADIKTGLALADSVRNMVWGVKLAPTFLIKHGESGIRRFIDAGFPVMADPKLYDIPMQVAGAATSCREAGAVLCTMHASMAEEGMRVVVEACGDDMLSLAVTVLTSMSDEQCRRIYGAGSDVVVQRLVEEALSRGCAHGLVCSPADLPELRQRLSNFDDLLFVTTGVRPAGVSADEQKRVATPGQAILNGATLLVIGRPISKASDPVAATRQIVAEIGHALAEVNG